MTSNQDERDLLEKLKYIARRKVCDKGTFTEFTGLIGELAVCQFENKKEPLGCKCKPKTKNQWFWNPGENYDAKDECEKNVQIKSRRLQTSKDLLGGRMGRFGSARTTDEPNDNYNFVRGILVVLDYDFEIAEIWELPKEEIENLEKSAKDRKEKSNSADKKLLGLNLRTFINKGNNKKPKQYIHDTYECFFKSLEKTYIGRKHGW